jgi:steroid 5-alpha reductase family enzyme
MSEINGVRYGFFTDRLLVVIAYVGALGGAWVSMNYSEGMDVWLRIGIADFVATVIIFLSSVITKNSSMYDPYWSVIPIIILGYLFVIHGMPINNPRVILASLVVLYWGIRLTNNWLITWPGLNHEDWRYKKLANDTGAFYWPVSFLGIHLFPTILVFLGCLALFPLFSSDAAFTWTDVVGFLVSLVAIEIERRADNQLREFKENPANGKVCNVGLWKYSRHPNYFGEITFWGGLFIMACGIDPAENLIYGIGFLCMVILFVFVSIPMMEKRQIHKPGYAVYREQVSMMIPWFRKK